MTSTSTSAYALAVRARSRLYRDSNTPTWEWSLPSECAQQPDRRTPSAVHGNCSALPRETRGSASVKRTRGKTRQGRLAPSLAPILSANEARSRSRTKGSRPANRPRGKANDAQGRLAGCGLGARGKKSHGRSRELKREEPCLRNTQDAGVTHFFLSRKTRLQRACPFSRMMRTRHCHSSAFLAQSARNFPFSASLEPAWARRHGRLLHRSAKLNIRPSPVCTTV